MTTDCSDSLQTATQTIAIVGAGFSGTMTAVNLLRGDTACNVKVLLFERKTPFGRGLAYRTWDDNFLLNVPAGNMSAFPDDPEDFVDYCRGIDPAFNATSFIPRRIYGDYIESLLKQAELSGTRRLGRVPGDVIATHRHGDGFTLELADGRRFHADRVVLAMGHLPPKPFPIDTRGVPLIESPWDFDSMDRLDAQRPVLLIGAGLTAIDTLFRLTRSSDARKVFLLSRRGLVPREHRFLPKPPVMGSFPHFLDTLPCSIRRYTRALRDEMRSREAAGGDWRDVINELRPHTPRIWQRLPEAERHRFITHLQAYWDAHRHRLAPSAHQRLTRMRESGQVEVLAGKVESCERLGASSEIGVRLRGAQQLRRLPVGGIVNCIGPNYDLDATTSPLVARLRDAGWIRQDVLGVGLDVDDNYRVIGRDGTAAPDLFYIGPMLKARDWEAIAVPELRVHSAQLARLLLADASRHTIREPATL